MDPWAEAPGAPPLPKRERTRRELMRAALAVIGERGMGGATAQQVAAAAGVANGTFYNYFESWDALLEAITLWLVETYCRHIDESYAHIEDGAERMAIGNRRYVLFAIDSPQWAKLMVELLDAGAPVARHIAPYVVRDLQLGIKQKRFRVPGERAALDLIFGTVLQAIRTVLAGEAGKGHAVATATMVLRGLGMGSEAAAQVARRPLPPLDFRLPEMPARR